MRQRRSSGRWMSVVLGLLLVLSTLFSNVKAATNGDDVRDFSRTLYDANGFQFQAGLVIDQETGQLLFAYQPDTKWEIASLTKLITVGAVYDKLDDGTLAFDTPVRISDEVAALSEVPGLSNVPLQAGEAYAVDDLIDAALVLSANAATVALAELVSGTESHFVETELMAQVQAAGVSHAELYTASGLGLADENGDTTDESKQNRLSPREYLTVMRHILAKHPDILKRTLQPSLTFETVPGETVTEDNANELVPGLAYGDTRILGGKTGTVDADNRALFVQAKLHRRPVLAVLLGEPDDPARYQDMQHLLTALAEGLEWRTIHRAGDLVQGRDPEAPVVIPQGEKTITTLYYAADSYYFVPKDTPDDATFAYAEPLQYDTDGHISVQAPLEADHVVNTEYYRPAFYATIDGKHPLTTEIKASEDVPKASFVKRISRLMSEFMANIRHWLDHAFAQGNS